MRTHNYLARIDDEIWLDLNRVKQLDGRSINSLLMEGARKIRDQKLMELSEQKKRRKEEKERGFRREIWITLR